MANNRERVDRTQETREAVSRIPTAWVPPSALPDPKPEPGYVYRWCRVSTGGEADDRNMAQRAAEGFVPVRAADHPEIVLYNESPKGLIESGGLVLCKAPAEQIAARKAYYENLSKQQIRGVDSNLKRDAGEDRRMPMFVERQTEVLSRNQKVNE